MGGSGSGAPRYRRIAEECRRIDIREWRRRGYLKGSHCFTWTWSVNGESSGSIGVATDPGIITLSYSVIRDEGPLPVNERVRLNIRPCRYGGLREYFACPRCARNAEVLYMAGGYFRCRKCARVGYAIENLEKQWRADRRYRQLETRLNEDGSRPARMRWATFRRICDQLEAYDAASLAGLERVMARLMRNAS